MARAGAVHAAGGAVDRCADIEMRLFSGGMTVVAGGSDQLGA